MNVNQYVPHTSVVLFAHADWLVRKWLASTIHLQATSETNYCIMSLISNNVLVYCPEIN